MPTRHYPVGAHALAAGQAAAHANLARSILAAIQESGKLGARPGEVLAFLVNAAFAIELYFKAMMLGARNGEVTLGHKLAELLDEFPPEVRESFSQKYASLWNDGRPKNVHLVALRLGHQEMEEKPAEPKFSFLTFDEAIASLSDVFVQARYFFERVNPDEWSVILFPAEPTLDALVTVESAYSDLIAGRFGHRPAG